MRTFLVSGLSLVSALSVSVAAEKKSPPDKAKLEETTRLQIFLDRANFGPGKIDGRGGEFTRKALQLYKTALRTEGGQSAQGSEAPLKEKKTEKSGSDEQLDTSGLDLQSVGNPFTTYTVTKEDVENVGEVPKDPAAQAKLESLPYRSALEAVAERFHSDIDFIKELNPDVDVEHLKEGESLTVPNVEPFELAKVKEIKPGEAFHKKDAAAGDEGSKAQNSEETKKEEPQKSEKEDEEDQKPKVAVQIDTNEKMLKIREGNRLIAAFPVTPGSDDIPSPIGEWKVKGVALMPDFRYDKKMLQKGERSENAHLLKPGPNNPVGVVWIALNKPGIGIHGTDDPDTIGRAASHGCIRLANWDAVKVARLVKGGVPVSIK